MDRRWAHVEAAPSGWPAGAKDVWGPRAWLWLHTAAIYYPDRPSVADRRTMDANFWKFVRSLPCPECRDHLVQYVEKHPLNLDSSDAFQMWAWELHNATNRYLKKPEMGIGVYMRAYADDRKKAILRDAGL